MDTATIAKRMSFGAAWMVVLKLSVRCIGIISLFIMARLLVAEDYGLIALAVGFYTILDIVTTFNFDMALIQNQKATKEDYNTAWTLNILMGVIIAAGLLVTAYPIALFYEEPRLLAIFPCLAFMALLQGFSNIGTVNFRKELDLKKEFYFELLKKLTAFFVTIISGFLFRSYWALILGMISSHLAGCILSFLMSKYRPSLTLARWRHLFHFSKWMLVNNILHFANHRLMQLIFGSYSNTKILGHYSMMKDIANLTTIELVWPIQRALFPGYSKLTQTPHALAEAFFKSISLIAFLGIPIAVTLAYLNDYFIITLLGEKWLDQAWMLRYFCLSGIFILVTCTTESIFYAVGKPYIVTLTAFIQVIVQLPLFTFFIANDQLLLAIQVILATSILRAVFNLAAACWLLRMSAGKVLPPLLRTSLSAFTITVAISFFSQWLPLSYSFWPDLLSLLVLSLIGAVAYLFCHFLLWLLSTKPEGAETMIIQLISSKIGLGVPKR